MTVRELIDATHDRLLTAFAHVNESKVVDGVIVTSTVTESQWQRKATDADALAIGKAAGEIAGQLVKQ